MTPAEQEQVLLHELGAYQPELLERPRVVVGTKADVADRRLGRRHGVSAVTGEGLRVSLLGELRRAVEPATSSMPERSEFVILQPEPDGVRVERVAARRVPPARAPGVARPSRLSDVTDAARRWPSSTSGSHRLGIDRALARAGAQPGDVVHIGAFSFDYQPDD